VAATLWAFRASALRGRARMAPSGTLLDRSWREGRVDAIVATIAVHPSPDRIMVRMPRTPGSRDDRFNREEARTEPRPARPPRTTSSNAGPSLAGSCFVCDRERVRVTGCAAPTACCKTATVGTRRPLLSSPREGLRGEHAEDPESAASRDESAESAATDIAGPAATRDAGDEQVARPGSGSALLC
jgi:hypothetical protein